MLLLLRVVMLLSGSELSWRSLVNAVGGRRRSSSDSRLGRTRRSSGDGRSSSLIGIVTVPIEGRKGSKGRSAHVSSSGVREEKEG